MAKQATELRYAVLFRVVFKYFGQLSLVLATLALVPLVMSVIFADTAISLLYGIVTGGLAAFGASLVRLRAPSRVQANEGMVLVALMLLFAPLVMSYPLMGSGFGFLDTFFEAGAGGAGGFGLKEEQVVGSEIPSILVGHATMNE